MKTQVTVIALVIFMAAGCAFGSGKQSEESPYSLYAWTAPSCPSTYRADREFGIFGVLGNLLIGSLIDTGFNLVGSALAEAAKQDKEGWARSGKNARYLYGVRASGPDYEAVPAACLIVAYAKTPTPAKWCDGGNPIPAMRTSCTTGKFILEALNSDDMDQQDSRSKKLDDLKDASIPPMFYAEIELFSSTDNRAVRPVIIQMHYPKPFQNRKGKTRNLVVSADIQGLDGKSISAVVLTLKDIVPEVPIADEALLRAEVLWTTMPAFDPAKPPPTVDLGKLVGKRVGPVNIITEIRETGEISKFLQAFAVAFKANADAASKELKGELTPGGRQASEAAEEESKATLENLRALAMKAGVDVLNACIKGDTGGDKGFASPEIRTATIAQLQSTEVAAKMKANAAAAKAGLSMPFVSTAPTSCPE